MVQYTYQTTFKGMGNTHQDRIIMPAKNRHVKLGLQSYLPSCSGISIQSSKSQLQIQNPESSIRFSNEQTNKSQVSSPSRSYLCNPSIFGDSSQNQDFRKNRKLSQKNERTLRIVKKIIGEDCIDFYTQQMLVYFIKHPDEKVANIIPRPNLREHHNDQLQKMTIQQSFLHKLIDKNIFGKQKEKPREK